VDTEKHKSSLDQVYQAKMPWKDKSMVEPMAHEEDVAPALDFTPEVSASDLVLLLMKGIRPLKWRLI
jgi:hypothetical protein